MSGILAIELRTHVIRPTLKKINLWSEAAENLLLGTCAHESQMGRYLTQVQGPALGIYQIEPNTHRDVWKNYLKFHHKQAEAIRSLASDRCTWEDKESELISNLAYSTAIARIIYYRTPKALPEANDVEGLAKYWKQYYNTKLGKGKVQDFIHHYEEYVL